MRRALFDRDSEYKNESVKELFKLLNIQYNFSTAYHHQTLGVVERNHIEVLMNILEFSYVKITLNGKYV